jgi:hypothetical protein
MGISLVCPICKVQGRTLNKFWLKEKVSQCKECSLVYRDRAKSEMRNPDILQNYANDFHKDDKSNGIKLFCSDVLSETIKDKTIIFDFGAGNDKIKKLQSIMDDFEYNKDIITYISLDIDGDGHYEINFYETKLVFKSLTQVFQFLNLKITELKVSSFFLVAHHVFEHVEEFDQLVIGLQTISIDVKIFFEVPAEDLFVFRTLIYYLASMPLYYIGHINFFTRKSIYRLASKFGMNVIVKTRTLYQNGALLNDFIDLNKAGGGVVNFFSKFKVTKIIGLTHFVKLEKVDYTIQKN